MPKKNDWSGFFPKATKTRAKPRQLESKLQKQCVEWFRLHYENIKLFSIPNGGKRDKRTAQILKMEGVLEGAPDLCLLFPNHGFHSFYIEMKSESGRQSKAQKEFELYCKRHGYKYVICRDFDQFKNEIRTYLTITK